MTNFEKWKADLTVDGFIDIMDWMTQQSCEPCILVGDKERKYCKCMLDCKKYFADWANAEVEDII